MLTVTAFGRTIPTTALLRTKAFQRMNSKTRYVDWSDDEWEVCLHKAKREIRCATNPKK